mgnify:CR=1 FL=1
MHMQHVHGRRRPTTGHKREQSGSRRALLTAFPNNAYVQGGTVATILLQGVCRGARYGAGSLNGSYMARVVFAAEQPRRAGPPLTTTCCTSQGGGNGASHGSAHGDDPQRLRADFCPAMEGGGGPRAVPHSGKPPTTHRAATFKCVLYGLTRPAIMLTRTCRELTFLSLYPQLPQARLAARRRQRAQARQHRL